MLFNQDGKPIANQQAQQPLRSDYAQMREIPFEEIPDDCKKLVYCTHQVEGHLCNHDVFKPGIKWFKVEYPKGTPVRYIARQTMFCAKCGGELSDRP